MIKKPNWEEKVAFLKELSNKEPLLTIKSSDIQEYDWDTQIITFTKEANCYLLLSHPDIFIVKQNGRFIYGGIFQDAQNSMSYAIPIVRCLFLNGQKNISILPHSIPFMDIDPIDEMGNFRVVKFDQRGNLEVWIPDNIDFDKSHTYSLMRSSNKPWSALLRKSIRNKDIRAAFLSTNQLKDESLTHTTELMKAAFNGDMLRFELALQSNHNINQADDFGRIALIYAAMNGNEGVFRFLLRNGADYKLWDNQLLSPLDYAEQGGFDSLAQLILEKDS